MKLLKLCIIVFSSIWLCGCAGWDFEYDPIEDEITIETVKEGNDEAD